MIFRYIIFGFFLIIIVNCARVGTPTGGPKDEKPPISINAIPDFESTQFKGNKIKIIFDEYVKFKDLNKQLVISPPLKYQPEITPMGTASKSINIKILDTLNEATTYTFNFGNAIVDNAEGNVLKQFKYLFSTGDFIDSLEISGEIKDAVNLKPDDNVYVMLYAANINFNDSIVYKQKPDYLTSTLDSTTFNITNVKEGKYSLVALKDKNNNLIFNPKEDKIGFLNQFVNLPTDSVYQLNLFREIPEFKINHPIEISKNKILISYEGEWQKNSIVIKDKYEKDIVFHQTKDETKDSIYIWFNNELSDSLKVLIDKNDKIETYKVMLRSKKLDSLKLESNIKMILHLKDTLTYFSNIPILKIDPKKITFLDSDSTNVSFQILEFPQKDKFQLLFEKKPLSKYFLNILPGAIEDFFGQTNDTLKNNFTAKKMADYGELKLNVKTAENSQIILELLNEKSEIISKEYLKNNKELVFSLLLPGKYYIRAIIDENENNKWDTGNYHKKIQPEKILYFSKTLEMRANWTINEEFNIKFEP